MTEPVVVRFAPSPTGYLHVGGARTALFNFLFARNRGGQFLLRIEDTDRARSKPEYTEQILKSLEWLGLRPDGAVVYQSQRMPRYREVIDELLASGQAYRCFCDREALDRMRATDPGWKYDGRCRQLQPEAVAARMAAGEPHVVRLRRPAADIRFTDGVRGSMHFDKNELDDMILVRSDGSPVYQLTVVVDDHDMGITHVIRGDDHLSNTPKQIAIYQAMGWRHPRFVHLPLILGPDRKRLSKRHGATGVEEYRNQGFVAAGLVNFLALLGWNPGDDREVMNLDELIQLFSLERINRSPAVFDVKKAEWLNAQHIAGMASEALLPIFKAQLAEMGIDCTPVEDKRLLAILDLIKLRVRRLTELYNAAAFFFLRPDAYDEKGVRKHFMSPHALARLSALLEWVRTTVPFEEETLENSLRAMADRMELKAGMLIHPLRLALTGRTASPGIFETLVLIGREEALARLQQAVDWLQTRPGQPSESETE